MKITKEEVLHVARLARLDLEEDSLDRFAEQIGKILEYVDPTRSEFGTWVDEPYLPKDGYLELRDRPGLGLEVDEDAVSGNEYRHWQRTAPVRPDGATGYI